MIKIKLPKMIMFDYGHTLVYEGKFDAVKADEAILKYVIKNPRNITAEELRIYAAEITDEIRKYNTVFEIHNHHYQKLLYEKLGMEFSLNDYELELLFWDNAAPATLMPGIEKVLDYIYGRGIRSGVISNISFSEKSLNDRINEVLPENKFEFIMSSSEYCFRKPHRFIFEVALTKAGLTPEEVWYIGDNTAVDITGASNMGIFPVWYDNPLECWYRWKANETPTCEHLHIREWGEFIDFMECL